MKPKTPDEFGPTYGFETARGSFVRSHDVGPVRLVDDPEQATKFDRRDNPELKRRFFSAVLKQPVTVVYL